VLLGGGSWFAVATAAPTAAAAPGFTAVVVTVVAGRVSVVAGSVSVVAGSVWVLVTVTVRAGSVSVTAGNVSVTVTGGTTGASVVVSPGVVVCVAAPGGVVVVAGWETVVRVNVRRVVRAPLPPLPQPAVATAMATPSSPTAV
jgi:hypothetical protein